jgi:hypothetical protein
MTAKAIVFSPYRDIETSPWQRPRSGRRFLVLERRLFPKSREKKSAIARVPGEEPDGNAAGDDACDNWSFEDVPRYGI